MRGLKFAAGLLAALLLHYPGVALSGGFSQVLDLFLVLTLFNALDGDLVAGMLGGLAAGLVADTVSGGLYGLNGFADTIVGYGAALATQRLVIQRSTGVFLFFLLAATVQTVLMMGLVVTLLQDPPLPGFPSIATKVVLTGLVGAVGFMTRRRVLKAAAKWRRNRRAQLR